MPDRDYPTERRQLYDDVVRLADGVRDARHAAHDLNLPVGAGVIDAEVALVRWANLLGEVIP